MSRTVCVILGPCFCTLRTIVRKSTTGKKTSMLAIERWGMETLLRRIKPLRQHSNSQRNLGSEIPG